jgi:hypothetical protein
MHNLFSHTEIQIVQTFLEKKPADFIALLIDKPVLAVRELISELIMGTDRKTFESSQRKQNLKKLNDKRFKEQDKVINRQRSGLLKKDVDKFQTKEVDLGKLVCIRVDAKTCIFIKPGLDPEKEKQKWLNAHQPAIYLPENPWKKVSKFK